MRAAAAEGLTQEALLGRVVLAAAEMPEPPVLEVKERLTA
jgi:hypothetical protein